MKTVTHVLAGLVCVVWWGSPASAQVDVEQRRILTLQSGVAVGPNHETISPYGYFWFNENHYPWEATALRFNYAGVYLDGELSYFLPRSPQTAIGFGLGGGGYSDDITPYFRGNRLKGESFDGDSGNARVFVNH